MRNAQRGEIIVLRASLLFDEFSVKFPGSNRIPRKQRRAANDRGVRNSRVTRGAAGRRSKRVSSKKQRQAEQETGQCAHVLPV